MELLTRIKVVLEVLLLAAFLILLVHTWRKDGRHNALSALNVLTNKP